MAELGAERLVDRVDCEPGDEEPAEAWFAGVLDRDHRNGYADMPQTTYVATSATSAEPRQPPAGTTAGRHSRHEPLLTRVTLNNRLGSSGSSKDVRQFSFAIDDDFSYRAGDALGVRPVNNADAVQSWLTVTGLNGDAAVELDGGATSLRDACTRHLEIVNITPGLLRFVNERAGDRELGTLLRQGNTVACSAGCGASRRSYVLAEYPVAASVEDWVRVLSRLQPRQYSISSSPLEHPSEVQLTVSAVRYEYRGQPRHGVCSTFLADHSESTDVPVRPADQPLPSPGGLRGADDHGRSGHRGGTVPRLSAGTPGTGPQRPELAVLR